MRVKGKVQYQCSNQCDKKAPTDIARQGWLSESLLYANPFYMGHGQFSQPPPSAEGYQLPQTPSSQSFFHGQPNSYFSCYTPQTYGFGSTFQFPISPMNSVINDSKSINSSLSDLCHYSSPFPFMRFQ